MKAPKSSNVENVVAASLDTLTFDFSCESQSFAAVEASSSLQL